MTAPQFTTPQPIRFAGAPTTALDKVLKESTLGQRILGRALQLKEGDNGLSYVTFLQDTLVALIPRALVSRSTAELSESGYLELLESAVLYYGLPILGNHVFKPLYNKMSGVQPSAIRALLSKEAQEKMVAKAHGAKAATILSTFGIALIGGEYMIHYSKNLMTAKMFQKDNFSDVVNLSQGKIQSPKNSPVIAKSENRIKQCLMACGGILAGSALLATGTGKFKALAKSAGFLEKYLGFTKDPKGGLCLSPNQMKAFMGLSIFAYLDSARDNLERVETSSRLLMIIPYLIWGQSILQNGLLKWSPKHFKDIVDDINKKQPKTLETLAKEAWDNAKHDPKLAAIKLADPLRQKALLTGVPLGFGILVTGIGVGLLNRFWTQYRFKKQQVKDQQLGITPIPTYNQSRAMNVISPGGFSSAPQAPAYANQQFPTAQPLPAPQPLAAPYATPFTASPPPTWNYSSATRL